MVAVSLRLKIRGMGMLLQFNLIGRSVFNAPLAPGSMHVDDVASVYIMVACTPLPLCWADEKRQNYIEKEPIMNKVTIFIPKFQTKMNTKSFMNWLTIKTA